MTIGLFVLFFAWLLALTLLVAGLVRHLATLHAAGGASTDTAATGFNFDTDGPWIPSALPDPVVEIFRSSGVQTKDLMAAFFSASCKACLARAEDIARSEPHPERTVFLLTGHHPEGLENLRMALASTGATLLYDPAAHDIVKSLDINSTPFAFRVFEGEVISKSYIRTVDDFRRVAAADPTQAIELPADAEEAHSPRPVLT